MGECQCGACVDMNDSCQQKRRSMQWTIDLSWVDWCNRTDMSTCLSFHACVNRSSRVCIPLVVEVVIVMASFICGVISRGLEKILAHCI